ncbi:ZPR1 zinc finger domain-containing protein [Methanopyrus sp. SNP6]|uniref:ZPR1 zinc finger domain-containing protein n=1 Tax=Methanopyrus sp. SNP6 TaxID=1937005 RepID=UPI001AEF8AFC|nr:ZPR1 zinc finger domain-containing protein [Methanopyrus sp. SNP6]
MGKKIGKGNRETHEMKYRMEFSYLECPVCGEKALMVHGRIDEIPHFGRVLEQFIHCKTCGYRRSDVMCLEDRKPAEYRYRVNSPEDLRVRVVRSPSGFVEIPELGVEVKPGPAAQGFVSNIEGLLRRIRERVETAARWADNEESKKRAEEILRRMDAAVSGEDEITIVLKDPYGHSAILPEQDDKLEVRELDEEEAEELRTRIFRPMVPSGEYSN